ncbi:MAG: L,D-transpeptidase [Acidimicrobiales bacterium]
MGPAGRPAALAGDELHPLPARRGGPRAAGGARRVRAAARADAEHVDRGRLRVQEPVRLLGGGRDAGGFLVYRRYDGLEQAPLGSLYRPLYFEAGYAIHGSPYVPDYPDSHGCVRLSDEDQDWLWELAPDDLQVTVYETMDPERLYPGSGRHGAPPLQPGPRPEALQPM